MSSYILLSGETCLGNGGQHFEIL